MKRISRILLDRIKDQKNPLSDELRLEYAKEFAIIEGLHLLQGHREDPSLAKPRRRSKSKVAMFSKWIEQRCPEEYRPKSHLDRLPDHIEEYMEIYIRTQCRRRWTMSSMDRAFKYALAEVERQKSTEQAQQQTVGEQK